MEINEAIKNRRSIRKFTDQKVEEETINEIIDLTRYSPSWKNSQTPKYYVVTSQELKNKIATECVSGFTKNADNINGAPALVVIAYDTGICGFNKDGTYTTSKEDRWEMFDSGIATQTLCLAAHSLGLGTVILGIFDEDKVSEVMCLPENKKVAALIPLGYPDTKPEAPKRKEISELLTII